MNFNRSLDKKASHKVYRNNTEYSFEEILAEKYFRRLKENTLIHKKPEHADVISIDEDDYENAQVNAAHRHMHSMQSPEGAYGNHIHQNNASAQQVLKSPYRNYSQDPQMPVNMHQAVHDNNSQRIYMNEIMPPHISSSDHIAQPHQLHSHQMSNQSLESHGQRMQTSAKESIREMDNWYGTPTKNYTQPVQAVQPFSIYQDSLTEHIPAGPPQSNQMDNSHINEFNPYAASPNHQHVYQINHNQHPQHEQHSQHHQHLQHSHQALPQHSQQPQHQSLQQHPLQSHAPHQLLQHQEHLVPHHHSHNNPPITEHTYVNDESMHNLEQNYGAKTPIPEHHYGHHVVNPVSPHVNRLTQQQHYPQASGEMTSMFNDSCNTQAFAVDLYKAQISTPVPKHPKRIEYENPDDNCSRDVMQQHMEQMSMPKQSLQQMPHPPIIMGGNLSTILETTREYQQSSTGSSVVSSGTDSVSLNRTSSKNMSGQHSGVQGHHQMHQSNEYISRSTPEMNAYATNQSGLAHFTTQSQPTSYHISPTVPYQNETHSSFKAETPAKKGLMAPESSNNGPIVPVTPNKYTLYRSPAFIVQSPAPSVVAGGFELPATPEAAIPHGPHESAHGGFQINEARTPNISRSMQNTLHISKDRDVNNSHIKNINEDSEDLEMEYQESEVQEIEPEPVQISFQDRQINKIKVEEKIKSFLNKAMIDPFNSELCEAFLKRLDFPDSEDRNCFIPVRNIPQLKQNTTTSVGPKIYCVEKELGKGAFGSIFRAIDNSNGNIVALKYQKPGRIWEYYICQEIRKRITDHEIICGFMQVSTAIVGPTSSILVSEFSKYGSLLNVSNKVRTGTTKPINEHIVMIITAQMLSVIHYLHRVNIIHGDIKPDNILLIGMPQLYSRVPSIQFIDFGCAIDMTLFPQGTEFRKVITTDGFTCSEMLDGRPWTYQTDLFCIAATTHVLLFGEYMKMHKTFGTTWEIKTKMPRYIKKKIWVKYFEKLLNIPDSNNLPDLMELRTSLLEGASSYNELNDRIRVMENILNQR